MYRIDKTVEALSVAEPIIEAIPEVSPEVDNHPVSEGLLTAHLNNTINYRSF